MKVKKICQYCGKEYYVGKIKSPIKNIGDWWNDDFD